MVAEESAGEKTECARERVQKKVSPRSIELFQCGTKLHQRRHVETDVNQSAVQKHRGDNAPPLVPNENHVRIARPEPVLRRPDESPQYCGATSSANCGVGHPTDAQHY